MTDGTKLKRGRSWWEGLATRVRTAQMRVSGPERRVRLYYEIYNADHFPTMRTRYVNLGYWRPDCASIDDAGDALADELADAAGMRSGDRVLDAGFGYADQDMHWLETRGPKSISGLNITPTQVRAARKRVSRRGLADRLDLRVGSATDMPFSAETFDRVVALESAFHFKTRRDFFREAFRVLRPGGTIATADVVPLRVSEGEMTPEEQQQERNRAVIIPPENWYTAGTYAECLREVGFVDVGIRVISEQVYRPLHDYLAAYVEDLTRRQVMTEEQHAVLSRHMVSVDGLCLGTDYIIASGQKPGRE